MWRKADIIADSVLQILNEDPEKFTGNQLIDEDYLRSKGIKDFSKYQCMDGCEPPKLMDVFNKFNYNKQDKSSAKSPVAILGPITAIGC